MDPNPASPLLFTLKRRGFSVSRSGPWPSAPPLLPADPVWTDRWYGKLHHYSFRLFLKDVIKNRPLFRIEQLSRYADYQTCENYLEFLQETGLVETVPGGFSLRERTIVSFGSTLEWYAAELLRREFGMESLYGVRFKQGEAAGDYDVLAGFDGRLLCVETKSSPPGQIELPAVREFLQRIDDLRPDIAIFLNDTRLRMTDKIIPFFEQSLAGTAAGEAEFIRIEGERFRLGHRVFVMNAHPGILFNVQEALRIYYQEKGRLF